MTDTAQGAKPKFYYRDLRSNAEKIVDETLKTRILAALELLQERHGADWVNHINPKTLFMAEGAKCVLGQVYGEYTDGLVNLGRPGQREINGQEYAFASFSLDGRMYDYDVLDKAWQLVFTGGE